MKAFTVRYGNLAASLVSQAWVSDGYEHSRPSALPSILEVIAVWDTGATNSMISPELASKLGISPIGYTLASYVGSDVVTGVYVVRITLPAGTWSQELKVLCADIPGCDVLIGMDIIGHGDFAVSNFQGETVMSFRTPSVAVTDYETAPADQQ